MRSKESRCVRFGSSCPGVYTNRFRLVHNLSQMVRKLGQRQALAAEIETTHILCIEESAPFRLRRKHDVCGLTGIVLPDQIQHWIRPLFGGLNHRPVTRQPTHDDRAKARPYVTLEGGRIDGRYVLNRLHCFTDRAG